MTDTQVQIKLNSMDRQIADLQNTIAILQADIATRTRISDLNLMKQELILTIYDNAQLISKLEQRLSKVLLPVETRYYLEEGEVEAFKSNFSKLKAMIARFERLYNSLVSYTANNT